TGDVVNARISNRALNEERAAVALLHFNRDDRLAKVSPTQSIREVVGQILRALALGHHRTPVRHWYWPLRADSEVTRQLRRLFDRNRNDIADTDPVVILRSYNHGARAISRRTNPVRLFFLRKSRPCYKADDPEQQRGSQNSRKAIS